MMPSRPTFRELAAKALYDKGARLAKCGHAVEAIAAYDDLLGRFGTATELPLRELLAKALLNKGARLGTLNHTAEAIAVYDDLLARFGTATETPLRELVSIARARSETIRSRKFDFR